MIHLDADVLDDEIMPAVDYRLEDGLTRSEFAQLLGVLLRSEQAVGLDVAIYNPALDPHGAAGRNLCDALADAFNAARSDTDQP